MKKIYFIIFIPLLLSCSEQSRTINLLEKDLGIKMPEKFEIAVNGKSKDYDKIIKLKLNKSEIINIVNQINDKHYGMRHLWRKDSVGYQFEFWGIHSTTYAKVDTINNTLGYVFDKD